MKIAVVGGGAIGGVVAAYLKDKGKEITLVSRPDQVEAVNNNGLEISGARGNINVKLKAKASMDEEVDFIILATKSQDIAQACSANKDFFGKAAILTTQNGVRADSILLEFVEEKRIISSIVMFGATYLRPGLIVNNFEGKWIIGRPFVRNDELVEELRGELSCAFEVIVSDEIIPQKWTKLFVNLNNCIPACCGLSMQQAFADQGLCQLALRLQREAYDITDKCGIELGELPGFNLEKSRGLARMPETEAAKIFSGIMTKLSDKPVYGSILQSIKRKRASEIDYINGEIAVLARSKGFQAPLNGRIVELVRRVEETGKFLSKEELLNEFGVRG